MITPAPVQTTYNQYETVAQNGMPASMTGWDADTKLAEAASPDGIGFGLAVSQSNIADRGAVLGQLSGGAFVGITMADQTLPNVTAGFTDKYQEGDNMAVLTRGDLWVDVVGVVAAGGSVYFNSVTGQLGPSGISNAVQITGAKWMTSNPAHAETAAPPRGSLAVVRLGIVA
jgi:hypothetical protein